MASEPTEPDRHARRASFADSPLDAEERDRLTALRAATSENAPLHVAVLSALSEAARAYHLQLRTAEIRSRLAATPHLDVDDTNLRQALDQLREWSCVDWVQDPSIRATSVEDYLKRHELWEITPTGTAALAAVEAVLGATAESGALQRTMFRQVRTTLSELAAVHHRHAPAGDAHVLPRPVRR